MMALIRLLRLLLLLPLLKGALALDSIAHPGIDFDLLGGQIAVLGEFDGLSFYNYANDSEFLALTEDDNQYLFLRNILSNTDARIATIESGTVTQLTQLSDDTVLVAGTFTTFNGNDYQSPIIYNVSSGDVTALFGLSSKREDSLLGEVKATLVDGDLIYLGGDFVFNNTNGAAVYNITSKTLLSLPFMGFGENSTVNSIIKYSLSDDEGSIIYGGLFDTLGLEQLLMHNISFMSNSTNSTNSTNTSLIAAEQVVSLKNAVFSNVNGASGNDDSSIICPSQDVVWSLQDNSGGQWAAELPAGEKGIAPTKVRIYVPEDSSDGVETFRIYTYPNNGIMNLTYVNPETNELTHCDASCPLLLGSSLKDLTDSNSEERESLSDDDTIYVDESGSYSIYYDSSTKSKSLGYGSNYQEFALVDNVAIDKIGITVTSWYGSKGEIAGFELYTNSIRVYGNDTLNESNCGDESNQQTNEAVINSGDWVSVATLDTTLTDTDYIVSVATNDSSSSITLYPNISYAGYYSLLFYTPGCTADDSCGYRSIVNVSLIDTSDQLLASELIYQNNLDDKFDYLYYGHLEGSSTEESRNRIVIEFDSLIDLTANESWVVVDKVLANIVSLDTYYSLNSTNSTDNSTSAAYEIQTMSLNGLFEYSLANFSNFSPDLVYSDSDNETIILDTNTFVGNSTINLLSGNLSEDSTLSQLILQNGTDSTKLLLLGDFASENITLLNSNLISLTVDGYSETYNETIANISTRSIKKRDEQTYLGVTFNDSILNIVGVNGGYIYMGAFSGTDNSTTLHNLANNNESTSTVNNFALSVDDAWYSFGNSYIDANFSQFASLDLEDVSYYIFSTLSGSYQVWDNTNFEWLSSSNNLDVSASLNLENRNQQIIGGSSFGYMTYNGENEAFFTNNTEFVSLNLNVTEGSILTSYYVNSSFSVLGGMFTANLSIQNVAVLKNNIGASLADDAVWGDDSAVTGLYVDTQEEYLFIGTNSSVEIHSSNVTGLVVYSLANGSFSSVQPPDLSTNDNSPVRITSFAYYDTDHKLLVGGHFDNAGSLDCGGVCIYDVANTRWINPLAGSLSASISGDISNAKFLSSSTILISGNLTLNGDSEDFVVYDFSKETFESAGTSLNSIGISDSHVESYIINEDSDSKLNGRMCAFGLDFVVGFDGNKWSRIDDLFVFDENTVFVDLKLVDLSNENSANTKQTYFDNDKALLLAGLFNLTDYGMVNVAIYDGASWIPYIFALQNSSMGLVNSLLFEDVYRFQSSSDVSDSKKKLSTGQIVGISLACALGSTALLGLLYLIPMFVLFKDSRKGNDMNQRIHEDEMMNVVNPEELFHEMDMQRNY